MNHIIRLLFLVIFLAFTFCSGIACATEKTYLLSYSPGTLFHQLVKERVRAVYERADLKAEFISLPHNRSLLSANEGTVDGDVGRVPSIEENYSNLLRVDTQLMELNGAAYTINPDINSYDESLLSHYTVGYVLGVRWPQTILAGHNAITARNYQSLFEMLLDGRVDLILATEASADAVLRDLGSQAEKVRQLQPFALSAPIYHYVNKKNAHIIPRLEQAIKEINQEGVFIFYTGAQTPLFEIVQRRLKEAFWRIGKLCEVRSTGSSQRSLMLANQKGDGDAFRIKRIKEINPEATDNLLIIPEPIGAMKFFVYTNGQKFKVTDWDSLNGKKNGLRIGAKILEKNIPEIQIRLPDTTRLLKMLTENRIDTFTEHGIIADFKLQKLNLDGITKLTPPLADFQAFSFIHKKHKKLIPEISASLKEMKNDGSFMQIEKDVFKRLLDKETKGTP